VRPLSTARLNGRRSSSFTPTPIGAPATLGALGALLLGSIACGAGGRALTSSDGTTSDAGPAGALDGAASFSDAGPERQDAGGAPSDGASMRVASLPASLVGVTADESELLYLSGDQQLWTVPLAGGPSRQLGAPDTVYPPQGAVWMFGAPDATNGARLMVYTPGTSTLATVARRAAYRLLLLSPTGDWALATDGFELREGPYPGTGTPAADLVAIRSDGTRRVLIPDIDVGRFDPVLGAYGGPCAFGGAFSGPSTALVSVCALPATSSTASTAPPLHRSLFAVDLSLGTARLVKTGVLGRIEVARDGSSFIYFDVAGRAYATSLSSPARTVPLHESAVLVDFALLDGARFAYSTDRSELKVASWPRMVPTTLGAGVLGIDAVSPNGAQLLYHQSLGPGGARDLYVAATSTESGPPAAFALSTDATALPGDDAFSADGGWVYWYADADLMGIGDIHATSTLQGGDHGDVVLANRGWFVLDYADPNSVVMMANAHPAGPAQRTVTDLAVRRRDGSGDLRVLASGCDASNFLVFPSGTRAAYRVISGSTGLWVRDLPALR
jgi:hypothetical protein